MQGFAWFLIISLMANHRVFANLDFEDISEKELEDLIKILLQKKTEKSSNHSSDIVLNKVEVHTQVEEVWATIGSAAQLFCRYTLSTGMDLPVTVTWKVGDGPRFATPLFVCNGYTYASKKCQSALVIDPRYNERVRIAQESPSLEIINVHPDDNRNFWCQVSLEQSSEYEMEFDMKSTVLRLFNGSAFPKLHSVSIDDDIATSIGENVSIDCVCTGHRCDDVYWYKGPANKLGEYQLVYSRTSYSRPSPTQYKAYNQWKDRAFLSGNSLHIENVQNEDRGRYWCEVRSSDFYAIGEWATDAKSTVLEFNRNSTNQYAFDCLGFADGLYEDEADCSSYYECVNYQSYHKQCPDGTVFNTDKTIDPYLACDYVQNVAPPCGIQIM